jgi:excisionase family DNA binding protein
VKRRSARQQRKVEEARRIAREALGGAARADQPTRAKYVPTSRPEPVPMHTEATGVWTPNEVAAKLRVSRAEVERMIAAGKLTGLPTGFTVTVPTSEVERLRRSRPTA